MQAGIFRDGSPNAQRALVFPHAGSAPDGMADEVAQNISAQVLIQLVNEVASAGESVRLYKRDCAQVIRRLKLILPLLEELRDLKTALPEDAVQGFQGLVSATEKAKQLVFLCQGGPKLYLLLEKDNLVKRFLEIAKDLAWALDQLALDKLEVSDEVCEQVQLVHSQLKRAKISHNALESRLHEDLLKVLSCKPEEADQAIVKRLAEGLHLKTFTDLRKESQAFQKVERGHGNSEKIQNVLRMFKNIADNTADAPSMEMTRLATGNLEKSNPAVIPDDFRCPISLELMKDPVIVATGQTYERASIQKWLDAGHKTCPKTQQVLPHLVLTPNYVLRSLIGQWCENNGLDPPKRPGNSRGHKQSCHAEVSPQDKASIDLLVQKLSCGQPEVQRTAAGEIRLLAKRSAENRVYIAEAGAIRSLVNLLGSDDLKTQEHAVTALLNLSINDNNKGPIVMLGAIDPIVGVLKSGSMEARENAAATLFSLSVVDGNKVTIGASTDAIPALVDLLRDGTARGKKDAATALYNLSIFQGNKVRAVRAGVVPHLMDLLVNQSMGMVDESLAILAILATHQEGRLAIGQAGAVPVLVELIKSGSSRNKENAAAVLHALSLNDPSHLVAAQQLGVLEPLMDLAQNGTARARRKANSLLEQMSKHQQQLFLSFDGCL